MSKFWRLQFTYTFAHSCLPNAIGITNGKKMQIRAIKNIDTTKEKITFDYLDGHMFNGNVQDLLIQIFAVRCECKLCLSNQTDAVRAELTERLIEFETNRRGDPLKVSLICLEVVELAKKAHGEYHHITTGAYNSWATFLYGTTLYLPKGLLKDVYDSVKIAFGEDHIYYKSTIEKFKNSPDPSRPTKSKVSIDMLMAKILSVTSNLRIGNKV